MLGVLECSVTAIEAFNQHRHNFYVDRRGLVKVQGIMVDLSSATTRGASSRAETHARHELPEGPPYPFDSVLHLSRYSWSVEHLIHSGDTAIDFGCGTGFGAALISNFCSHVTAIDLDPGVLALSERWGTKNVSFLCDDACSKDLTDRVRARNVDVILSMETIEHLEDYFTYIENAIAMMKPAGVFAVGTPNRTMTYERYPNRSHMDVSHVQEFSAISLGRTLSGYFDDVEVYYQYLPEFWSTHRTDRLYDLSEVKFDKVLERPELASDAFGVMAVCRRPKALRPSNN
jgi:2-polyprenyl-3-methyl-5-hydroxy-6-metoxy-1,4-benzoquinol methylase